MNKTKLIVAITCILGAIGVLINTMDAEFTLTESHKDSFLKKLNIVYINIDFPEYI